MDMGTPTGFIVYKCEYAVSLSHNFDHFRVLTESSVQRDQDTATLFEDEIQTVDAKGSFWVRTSDWL